MDFSAKTFSGSSSLTAKSPLPPIWMSLWSPLLAAAWLIPNHYYPWATFHSDAWVAVVMAAAAAAVFARAEKSVQWHVLPLVIAALATIPFLQYAVGMLPYSGQAWLYTAYVLGLLLALLAGASWERATPGQSADGLLIAIGLAALVSVGLQLRQWLGLGVDPAELQVWTEEFTPGRPSANLGQPNQLATILLWGLVACGWGVVRGRLRPGYFVAAALCLIFGLTLTQSRAGAIAFITITVATWIWRRFLPARSPQVVTLLLIFFMVCTFSLQHLSDVLGLEWVIRPASLGGASSQLRLKAYRVFLDALMQRPLWGYGWDQLAAAQLAVAERHITLTSFFLHSHNLFLDLLLWCGVLVGGLLSIYLVGWTFRTIRRVASAEDALLVFFLISVGVHAMVELPLHHAYLLLPTGLVMGILNQRQRRQVVWESSRWTMLVFCAATCMLLGTIMRDYLRVDESFRRMRLDLAHIGNLPPGLPPDVLILNQMRDFIVNGRLEVQPDFKAEDLEALHGLTVSFPTPANLLKYAKALAFLHRPDEARLWIAKVQKVQPAEFNPDMRRIWEAQSKTNAAMAAVAWPDLDEQDKAATR